MISLSSVQRTAEELMAKGAEVVGRFPDDLGLHVEGKTLLGAPGEVMQMAAHGPQKALGALEPRRLFG